MERVDRQNDSSAWVTSVTSGLIANPLPVTHASPYAMDARERTLVRTLCGQTIRAGDDAGIYATCPKCLAWMAAREAMEMP